MNIAEYWNEKTALFENTFEGWQRNEEIQIRKLVIANVMDIPVEQIGYYLKRDTWYLKFVLGDDSEADRTFVAEERINEKVQKIITKYFYKKDYETLCGLKGGSIEVTDITKESVRDCIKEGMYLCLHKLEQSTEAEEYLLLTKEKANTLYERSGAEKDKKLLDEILSY